MIEVVAYKYESILYLFKNKNNTQMVHIIMFLRMPQQFVYIVWKCKAVTLAAFWVLGDIVPFGHLCFA